MGNEVKFEVVERSVDLVGKEAYLTIRASIEGFTFDFQVWVTMDDVKKFESAERALASAVDEYLSGRSR